MELNPAPLLGPSKGSVQRRILLHVESERPHGRQEPHLAAGELEVAQSQRGTACPAPVLALSRSGGT